MINISLPVVSCLICTWYGVCIIRTYYMIRICTTWVQRITTRFGDTNARFAVWYVRTYHTHTHLPGSYRSRSDIVYRYAAEPRYEYTVRVCPSLIFYPLLFFTRIRGSLWRVFVGYRVVIDRACTRTRSHSSPTSLSLLRLFSRPLLINSHLPLGRLSFTSSAERSSCCCPLREVLISVVADWRNSAGSVT